jgi:hypothetical protein
MYRGAFSHAGAGDRQKYKNMNCATEGNDICVQLPFQDSTRGTIGGTGIARRIRVTRDMYVSCLSLSSSSSF